MLHKQDSGNVKMREREGSMMKRRGRRKEKDTRRGEGKGGNL